LNIIEYLILAASYYLRSAFGHSTLVNMIVMPAVILYYGFNNNFRPTFDHPNVIMSSELAATINCMCHYFKDIILIMIRGTHFFTKDIIMIMIMIRISVLAPTIIYLSHYFTKDIIMIIMIICSSLIAIVRFQSLFNNMNSNLLATSFNCSKIVLNYCVIIIMPSSLVAICLIFQYPYH